MRWDADERRSNKLFLIILTALVLAVPLLLNVLLAHHVAAEDLVDSNNTKVGVTLCAPGSTITLTTPVSDSVVTTPTVEISGDVVQASQIEVRIDDEFDSVIPLDLGQETFSGSVQLTSGTHTIKVTAINTCPGTSGTATSVVTYTPPPQTSPSNGSDVPTTAGEGVTRGGKISQVDGSASKPGIIDKSLDMLKDVARWLNVRIDDKASRGLSAMSVGQAVALTGGLVLAIIGVAPPLLHFIANIPGIAGAIPGETLPLRIRFLSIGSRVFGLVLVLGSLFL